MYHLSMSDLRCAQCAHLLSDGPRVEQTMRQDPAYGGNYTLLFCCETCGEIYADQNHRFIVARTFTGGVEDLGKREQALKPVDICICCRVKEVDQRFITSFCSDECKHTWWARPQTKEHWGRSPSQWADLVASEAAKAIKAKRDAETITNDSITQAIKDAYPSSDLFGVDRAPDSPRLADIEPPESSRLLDTLRARKREHDIMTLNDRIGDRDHEIAALKIENCNLRREVEQLRRKVKK